MVGMECGIGFRMVVYYKAKNAKKFRQGVEYSSARWKIAKFSLPLHTVVIRIATYAPGNAI